MHGTNVEISIILNRLRLKYLTFENFSKTFDNVYAFLGPLSGPWKGLVQVRGPEAGFISFTVNPPLRSGLSVLSPDLFKMLLELRTKSLRYFYSEL